MRLLTAYTGGAVPSDAECREVGASSWLQNWIGLRVRSSKWEGGTSESGDGLHPLHIRYNPAEQRLTLWDEKGMPVRRVDPVDPAKKAIEDGVFK